MLGFLVSIYKLQNGNEPAVSAKAPRTKRLAVWQTDCEGLRWIDRLVQQGLAVCLGGDGYPISYTAQIEHVRSQVLAGPPAAREAWHSGLGDILSDRWEGKTTIDHDSLNRCSPTEWVLIEAWDES